MRKRFANHAVRTAWVFPALIALCIIAASCNDDDGGGGELHWFDCQPVLEKLASCDIAISLNGADETDADTAYDSCQFARGNMWLRMFKCYKENESCEDLALCLPEHGFMTPEMDDDTDDDTADDDAADDDTTDDDTTDDDTVDDDTADDDSA